MMTRAWAILLIVLLSAPQAYAAAVAEPVTAAASEGASPEAARETLLKQTADLIKRVEIAIDSDQLGGSQIETFRAALEERRQQLVAASSALDERIKPVQAELDALGAPPEEGNGSEPDAIQSQRAEIGDRLAELQATQKRLQGAATQVTALQEKLFELRRKRFTQALLERQVSPASPERIVDAWGSLVMRASVITREIEARIGQGGGATSLIERMVLPLILALAVFGLAFALRRQLIDYIGSKVSEGERRKRRARLALAITAVRLIMPLLALAIVFAGLGYSGILGPNGEILLRQGTIAAAILIAAYAFGTGYFAPYTMVMRLADLDDARARSAYRWFMMLAAVVAVDQFLLAPGDELRLTTDALSVMNALILIIGGVAVWRFLRAIGLGRAAEDQGEEVDAQIRFLARTARFLAHVISIASPVLALIGYYAASRFLFFPAVYSAAVIGTAVLIYQWVLAVSEPDHEDLEATDDEEESEADRRQSVLPVVTGFTLAIIALPMLAIIWGAKATDLQSAWAVVVEGFSLGEITISPVDFIVFGIVFAVGYFLTRIVQGILNRSVLPVMRIDPGAKSALLTGIGYVGITVAALVAISTTGIDLSNLAIVAGALSVGIGFGLQNVVNNFVSGIILLIERPIKVGDWIEVGGTHGIVRRITVRSTQIQKFDRSTMFVPNGDLISGIVTNWYWGASQGQLILPVGVAYGSDVRKVEKILLEVARDHPMVARVPEPFVIFKDFGASSLDFELRGIMNDVNQILRLPSELRFAIYQRFEAEGIEIPFAHSDVKIRNLDEIVDALGRTSLVRQRAETGAENDHEEVGGVEDDRKDNS